MVKRRLDLGIEYLAEHAAERQEFILDNGARMLLPKGELGNFLKALYLLIFARRGNVSRIMEAIAGRDVRKALEMFVSVVTSGHLSTSAITSNVKGQGEFPINERHILRILMRTDYRFFSDNNSNVTNIFNYENDWARPDNFLISEVLYFLIVSRKRQGEIGLEGYFSVRHVCDHLQRFGYDPSDVWQATIYLLQRQLIIADNFNTQHVELDDCVKIQASGFMHLRILCGRIEYLFGIIPVTPIADPSTSIALSRYVNQENQQGDLSGQDKARAVEVLYKFLKKEMLRLRETNPFYDAGNSGGNYVLRSMDTALRSFFSHTGAHNANHGHQDQLDLT